MRATAKVTHTDWPFISPADRARCADPLAHGYVFAGWTVRDPSFGNDLMRRLYRLPDYIAVTADVLDVGLTMWTSDIDITQLVAKKNHEEVVEIWLTSREVLRCWGAMVPASRRQRWPEMADGSRAVVNENLARLYARLAGRAPTGA